MQQEIARHGDFLQLDVTVRLSHYRHSLNNREDATQTLRPPHRL